MKKTIIFFIVVISLLSFFTNCSPTLQQHNQTEIEKARQYWINETESTLINSWGPPNSRETDGYDGQILTYKRYNGYITWITYFYVNKEKVIYNLNAHSE